MTLKEKLLADTLDVNDFARFVGIHPESVRIWIRRDGLPAIRFGKKLYLHKVAAQEWIIKNKYEARSTKDPSSANSPQIPTL